MSVLWSAESQSRTDERTDDEIEIVETVADATIDATAKSDDVEAHAAQEPVTSLWVAPAAPKALPPGSTVDSELAGAPFEGERAAAPAKVGPEERPEGSRKSAPTTSSGRVGALLTAVGVFALVFCAYQFGVSNLVFWRDQQLLVPELQAEFDAAALEASQNAAKDDVVLDDDALELLGEEPSDLADETALEPIAVGSPVALVQIERLGTEAVVVEGTSPSELDRGIGHFRSTPLPGQRGNAVLAGRQQTYGGPFKDLETLEPGDIVSTTTASGTFEYEVVEGATRMDDTNAEFLAESVDRNLLTLTTGETDGLTSMRRVVVVAELVGLPSGAANPLILDGIPDDAESGLGRDSGAWFGILLWGELLILAVWGTRKLYNRWQRWPTWIITTPILVALAILVVEQVGRLLPAAF